MSDLALRLIAENKASHKRGDDTAKYLDLGNCGLTALPEELFELEKLSGLQSLNLNGNQISDLRPLEKLTGLKSLDLPKPALNSQKGYSLHPNFSAATDHRGSTAAMNGASLKGRPSNSAIHFYTWPSKL